MRAFGDSAGAVLRAISRDGQGAPAAPGAPQPTEAAEGTRRWLFDLRMANRLVLRQAGVPDSQIHVTDAATGPGEGPGGGLFFSHRAERPCGRFAALARLSPRAAR
jgi:copper oxidase (laccase) domain-containing protein